MSKRWLTLQLPLPPTVNNYLIPRRTMKCKHCGNTSKIPPPYLSHTGRDFRNTVIFHAVGLRKFGDSKLAVRVDIYPKVNAGDIDNRTKPLLDALEHAGIFNNDNQVKDLRLVWHHAVHGGRAEVKLWEM